MANIYTGLLSYPTLRDWKIADFVGTEVEVVWAHSIDEIQGANLRLFSLQGISNSLGTVIERYGAGDSQIRIRRGDGSAFPVGSEFRIVAISSEHAAAGDAYVKAQAGARSGQKP